ncbi:MAG: hypothetical protein M3245_01910 [Actinomycetota bacterium]|nr:hypothetical protein [Actinomycetota bacterium]
MGVVPTSGRAAGAIVAFGLLAATLPGPALAASSGPVVRPGGTERVSVSSAGAEGDAFSGAPAISGDGRYVAFASSASNLVSGDANGVDDVFVHDRVTGRTERVSVSSTGEEANGVSADPVIDADGRHVAFTSGASNLVPGDTNGDYDVFVRDLAAGVTELVSVASTGHQATGSSNDAAISADGRHVAFSSGASNLVPGDTNGWGDAFVRDRQAGTTVRASLATGGVEADLGGGDPSISPDGRHVAFGSIATNLDGLDATVGGEIYLRDLDKDTTVRVSVAHDGSPANDQSVGASVSAGGRFVAFRSSASNLVPGDRNSIPDFFVRDTAVGRTERVSVSSAGAASGGIWYGSPVASITPDGRHVAFATIAPGLVDGDDNLNLDAFVHDRRTGSTEVVTVTEAGDHGFGTAASISADARHVAFVSNHPAMVAGDGNDEPDVFVRDRGPGLGVGAVSVSSTPAGLDVAGWATFSGARLALQADPGGDAAGGPVGADLAGAEVAYRPHAADLLLTWRPTAMAAVPGIQVPIAGPYLTGSVPVAPAVYAFSFRVDGTVWEVRGASAGAAQAQASAPSFALFRCVPACQEVASLSGGLGDRGVAVTAAVPLSLVAAEGSAVHLEDVAASTRSGTLLAPVHTLDEVTMGPVTVPSATISLALGSEGGRPPDERFDPVASTVPFGRFRATLAESLAHPLLWTRVCLGTRCRYAAFPAG